MRRIVCTRLGQAQVDEIQLKVSAYCPYFVMKTCFNRWYEGPNEEPKLKVCVFNSLQTLAFKFQKARARTHKDKRYNVFFFFF